jgi:hypothetical protein
MNNLENRIEQLEKVLTDLLDEFRYWNNGCGCCGDQTAHENDEYKKAEEVLHTNWKV